MRGIGFGAIGPDDVIGHRPARAVGADSGGPRLPSDVVADFTRRIPIVCIAHHHPQAVDDATANFNDQGGAEFGCAVIGYDNSTIAALPPVGLASIDHAGQIPGGDSNPAFARADRGPDRSQSCAAGVRCLNAACLEFRTGVPLYPFVFSCILSQKLLFTFCQCASGGQQQMDCSSASRSDTSAKCTNWQTAAPERPMLRLPARSRKYGRWHETGVRKKCV